jgi:hypothetical protein
MTYHQKLARVLDRMGGVYLLDDILDLPRARQLQLIAMVGDLSDVDALHAKILEYADEVHAGLLSTHGRLGWLREGSFRQLGWRLKAKSQLYMKEL